MGLSAVVIEDLREGASNADYDLAASGTLAYVRQSRAAYERIPVIVDRQGQRTTLSGIPPGFYQHPRFSPDGRQLLLMRTTGMIDIWAYDFDRSTFRRVTTEGSSQHPVWSPDGQRIAYRATRSGYRNIFWRPADGSDGEQPWTTGAVVKTPWSWSEHGLLFEQAGAGTANDIWLLPAERGNEARPVIRTPFRDLKPRFAQDGRTIAYVTDQSGRPEVHVQSFVGPPRRQQVSSSGGDDPVWARSGRELFFRNGLAVLSAAIGPDGFPAGPPRVLFTGNYLLGEPTQDFDVAPDGQRFALIQPSADEPLPTHIDIVLNWTTRLQTATDR